MVRKFLMLCALAALLLAGLTAYYATTGPAVPAEAAPSFELDAIRAQVSGTGPTAVLLEEVGTGQMREFILFAGGGLHEHPIAMHAVELRWDDRAVLIDPGTDLACSRLFSPGLVVHADAFARMEAKIALAVLLSRFDLDLDLDHPIALSPSVTLRPTHGVMTRVCVRGSGRPGEGA